MDDGEVIIEVDGALPVVFGFNGRHVSYHILGQRMARKLNLSGANTFKFFDSPDRTRRIDVKPHYSEVFETFYSDRKIPNQYVFTCYFEFFVDAISVSKGRVTIRYYGLIIY